MPLFEQMSERSRKYVPTMIVDGRDLDPGMDALVNNGYKLAILDVLEIVPPHMIGLRTEILNLVKK